MILNPDLECMSQEELQAYVKEQLSTLFRRAYDHFSYYRQVFEEAQLDPEGDPLLVLEKLPFMEKSDYDKLEEDAVRFADRSLYYVETTSGLTGKPKKRFQSFTDELNELGLAMRVFAGFNLSKEDVIVFMDVGDPTIYLWFAKACENLGLKDTIYYGVQSDFKESLKELIKLDPTVLFTVPSLLARSYETLSQMYKEAKGTDLQKIIYFGEKLSDAFRRRLEEELGVEIFSHYGSAETSTLGGECHVHDGIHVYTDANVPSLVAPSKSKVTASTECAADAVGEIAWTTMQIDVQPVIKYRVGDVVELTAEPCACGRTSPRVKVIGRTEEGFSLYGEKFYYDTFLNAIYSNLAEIGFLQIILESEEKREKLTLILPEKLRSKEDEILDLLYCVPELEFYLEEDFVKLTLRFVHNSYFTRRKIQPIVDTRNY